MKYLTEKNLVLFLILACLVVLFYRRLETPSVDPAAAPVSVSETEKSETEKTVPLSPPLEREKVIYLCRLGNEEIPAVQILEITDADGQTLGVSARAAVGSGIEIKAPGAVPVWDYKSVSADSENNVIEVAYAPGGKNKGADWVLTLADENVSFSGRVRDCLEVSDE